MNREFRATNREIFAHRAVDISATEHTTRLGALAPGPAPTSHTTTKSTTFRYRAALPRDLFIEPGSPWENGYCASFNSKLRDERLNGEIFTMLYEVRALSETDG